MAACPDDQWRLIFALARYGGLRIPSEIQKLQWADIDWEKSRFTVYSPKTEHVDGKGTRQVPLFPELRPYLESWAQHRNGDEALISRAPWRQKNAFSPPCAAVDARVHYSADTAQRYRRGTRFG